MSWPSPASGADSSLEAAPLYSSTKPATRSKSDKASPAPGESVGTVGLLNKRVVTDPEIDAECI